VNEFKPFGALHLLRGKKQMGNRLAVDIRQTNACRNFLIIILLQTVKFRFLTVEAPDFFDTDSCKNRKFW
jgi:hypothetical protein